MPRTRFNDLSKEYQKVVSKMTARKSAGAASTDECDFELKDFLGCMASNGHNVSVCRPEQLALTRCVQKTDLTLLRKNSRAQARRVKSRLIARFARYIPK